MPLPLFRFPYLALKVILNQLKDIELVKVSLCSRKAKHILKSCGKEEYELWFFDRYYYDGWNCLEAFELSFLEAKRAPGGVETELELCIKVELGKTLSISFEYYDDIVCGYQFEIESIRKIDEFTGLRRDVILDNVRVPIVLTDDETMYIFWDDVIDGLLFLLKCYNKWFSSVVYTLEYYRVSDSVGLKRFVDYTSSLSVKSVTVAEDAVISVEDYKYIVENSKLSHPEKGLTFFTSYYEHDQAIQINNQIQADILYISSGNLISIQYFLECNHEHVEVQNSKFTNDQIKVFMEQWMNKKFPNLSSIRLQMNETINWVYVLEGMPVCESSESWNFIVERSDGVIAVLKKFSVERFDMKVAESSRLEEFLSANFSF